MHWRRLADPCAIQLGDYFSFLCVPSQSGALPLPLHPQKYTVVFSVAAYFTGVNSPVALCEPSQNGWLLLCPHAHHQ